MSKECKTLQIIAQNCRGLADYVKRKDVLNFLRSKKPDIVFLEDIHIKRENVDRLLNEWGHKDIVAPGQSNSRGVAILFNNTFQYNLRETYSCPKGNYVLANVEMLESNVTLGCVYGPNEDNAEFYKMFFEKIENMGNDKVIIGGDWNFVLKPELDYLNYKRTNNKNAVVCTFIIQIV